MSVNWYPSCKKKAGDMRAIGEDRMAAQIDKSTISIPHYFTMSSLPATLYNKDFQDCVLIKDNFL